jgi:hypothetical protein
VIVRGCPLGTVQDRCEWHAYGTASEDDPRTPWRRWLRFDRRVRPVLGEPLLVGKSPEGSRQAGHLCPQCLGHCKPDGDRPIASTAVPEVSPTNPQFHGPLESGCGIGLPRSALAPQLRLDPGPRCARLVALDQPVPQWRLQSLEIEKPPEGRLGPSSTCPVPPPSSRDCTSIPRSAVAATQSMRTSTLTTDQLPIDAGTTNRAYL